LRSRQVAVKDVKSAHVLCDITRTAIFLAISRNIPWLQGCSVICM